MIPEVFGKLTITNSCFGLLVPFEVVSVTVLPIVQKQVARGSAGRVVARGIEGLIFAS